MPPIKTKEVDIYISTFPKSTQNRLKKIRETILKIAPEPEKPINYKMPAYKYKGVLVFFAGYKNHIGFYPSGTAIIKFKKELAKYKGGKGSIQFPLDQDLPIDLIEKIVKFRYKENQTKWDTKTRTKSNRKSELKIANSPVDEYIQKLEPTLGELIKKIGKLILKLDKNITEQIKWNSVSYYYHGPMKPFDPKEYKRDLLVINLTKGYPLLVFPTGSRINGFDGVLEGNYKDGRRLLPIKDAKELKIKEQALMKIIQAWLNGIEMP
jgi:uncharacterized protein YdhG (YjbR/CyaY superfamily)